MESNDSPEIPDRGETSDIPGLPSGVISGLRETFIQRYIVKRIDKAEIGHKERSEKAESCRENLWNQIQLKGP